VPHSFAFCANEWAFDSTKTLDRTRLDLECPFLKLHSDRFRLGGWATLTAKYSTGLPFNVDGNNWGCATSRAVREVACRTADTVRLRRVGLPPGKRSVWHPIHAQLAWDQARPTNSRVSVDTLIVSPSLMKRGTRISMPVSSFAGLVTLPLDVSPRTPGSV
jgi:hypothetical protein